MSNRFAVLKEVNTKSSNKEKKTKETSNKPIKQAKNTNNTLKKRGRPRAKRSDPNYSQVTAYIETEAHKKVKIKLLQQDKQQEFSELVNQLLKDWLIK
jgi:uncharacterized membrane protein YqiK